METKIEKQKGNTYKVEVKLDSSKVQKAFKDALTHEAENTEIKGFRKGKAPLHIAKKNIDKSKIRNHALNHLISDIFSRIIKENKLTPIVSPKFDIKVFEEDKDLELDMYIIERPEIKIGNYKEAIKKMSKEKSVKKGKDTTNKTQTITTQDIIDSVLSTCNVEIASQLIEEETNRMMSSLIDQTARLGLTVDKYLQSQNKTADQLRKEYEEIAKKTLQADFIITEISQKEKVEITDTEIDVTINAVPDQKSKEALKKPDQRMYIKAVLLKNKTIQKLVEYANLENKKEDKK